MPRDYYEILGVERDAETGTIKRAYRKLAMRFHPDRNPGDAEAESSFREATEAYNVLLDEQKRAVYDRHGHAGLQGGMGFGGVDLGDALSAFMRDFGDVFGMGMGGGGQPGRGDDLRVGLRLDLIDVLEGTDRTIRVQRAVECETCTGSGSAGSEPPRRCETCNGVGQVRRVQRSLFGQFLSTGPCPQCGGSGETIVTPCGTCSGEGRVRGEVTVRAEVPAGVSEGDVLNMRGQGDAGRRGAPSGDLHVHLEVRNPDGFERHGRDVVVDLPVGPGLAAVGGEIDVPTLEGAASLKIPSGVQHGTLLRMKGKGLPSLRGGGRGNQFVRVSIAVPEKVRGETKKLYRRLAELERDDT